MVITRLIVFLAIAVAASGQPQPAGPLPPAVAFIPSSGLGVHTAMYLITQIEDLPDFDNMASVEDWTGTVDFDANEWSNLGYNDNFASRHAGYLTVNVPGDHTFYLTSDDGSRMFLDGVLIINNGGNHPTVTKTATKYLVPRQYEVRIEYFQGIGGKDLKWEWKQPGQAEEKEVVPLERLDPLYCPTIDGFGRCEAPSIEFFPFGFGVHTEMFQATSMRDFPVFRSVAGNKVWTGIVDFNSTEWSDLGYDNDFASKHTGYLTVNVEGYHTFYLSSDDGSRMFLDGVLIIDNGGNHPTVTKTATRYLVPRQYEVRIEYFQGFGGKDLKWEWKQPGQAEKEVVPLERLNPLYCPSVSAGRCVVSPLVVVSSGVGIRTEMYRAAPGSSTLLDFPNFANPDKVWTDGKDVDFNANDWSNLGYNNQFASRHTGYLTASSLGYHTFYLTSDDGSRLFVNGDLIIDNGGNHPSVTKAGVVFLVPQYWVPGSPSPSAPITVRIEYFQGIGGKDLKLEWKQPGQAEKEVVPLGRLNPWLCTIWKC